MTYTLTLHGLTHPVDEEEGRAVWPGRIPLCACGEPFSDTKYLTVFPREFTRPVAVCDSCGTDVPLE